MRRLFIILIAILLAMPTPSQTKKTSTAAKKTTATAKKQPAQKKATTTTKKKTTATSSTKKKTTTPTKKKQTAAKPTYTNKNIQGLQQQRSEIQRKIRQQEQALKANQADVKKRLDNIMQINADITAHKKNIENIEKEIGTLDADINLLTIQLDNLQSQLTQYRSRYIKSMSYLTRNHTVEDRLMFIFSAKNLAQMYRRTRFVKEYADYQKVQGEAVKAKQEQVKEKHAQLQSAKGHKNTLLERGKKERTDLEAQQSEQKKMVSTLQQQQKTIQGVIAQQKQKDAKLNSEIDRLVAIEIEKARQRAIAEAKKKAEAEAAEKKRKEELARKKAAAAAAAKENERLVAEARKREAEAKKNMRDAQNSGDEAARQRAEQQLNEAESNRKAAELKASADATRNKKDIENTTRRNERETWLSSSDRKLSGSFEANKGRLPIPITGGYRIVRHFGQYNVEGLKNVSLDSKGINIKGQPGCQARSIYDGTVGAVFSYDGAWAVMVSHGAYISVYCNLRSVSVSTGQRVSTRQALGTVGTDNILQFQLRHRTAKLNPEAWLGR